MICPQTKAECPCTSVCCVRSTRDPSVSWIAPPKPTMSEIERLVDAHKEASTLSAVYPSTIHSNLYLQARAALIDYVKRMGVE